ncbi:pilus assembly protein TadG-related protein [Jiella sp. MQZ9-1]|uniref:VWA domain-containing protein n=1 Tax=Jiella flava TaxID=2816857 RepID=A0A939JRV6_9HYPH|nr:pilus assembly protein [Jiella flava]MBO0662313.1 VWA domain-containing protein [Jiella flava]MCD2470856.1 pilus assembly protein TadG-related protein [Jiella flava]
MWTESCRAAFRRGRATLRRLVCDRSGNFGVFTALAAVPLILAVGGVVDYSNALRQKENVQSAADAAVLAAAKYSGSNETERLSQANGLFTANLDKDVDVTSTKLINSNGTWIYDANFTMPTAFLGLMQIHSLDMAVEATAKHADIPLDIALVLDSTGSMAQSGKMTQLKAAVKLFLSNFDEASDDASVQVSMVPFDTDVRVDNVNMDMLSASQVQCSKMSSPDTKFCSPDAAGFKVGTSGTYYEGYSYRDRAYLAYIYTTQQGSDGVISVARTTYRCAYPYSWCSNSTAIVYQQSAASTRVSGNFSGCVIDRSQPYDTRADAPDVSNPDTLYVRDVSCTQSQSLQPIVPLTSDLSSLSNQVDKLTPSGNTNITIGLQWGMETLTPTAPMTGGNTDTRTKRIMILLTDGENTADRWYNQSESDKIDARTKLACTNAKSMANPDGSVLELYTIRLIEGDETLLKSCATDDSHYYSVQSASELTSVFQNIAERVKRIRIVS